MSTVFDRDELFKTAAQTLEETAFLFVEPVDPGAIPWSGELIEARLRFDGPERGELAIATTREHATALAANLLGVDPDSPEAERAGSDAVGELVNILCGVLLEKWFPGDRNYRMGTPIVRSLEPGRYEGEVATAVQLVAMGTDEGERIDVAVLAAAPPPGA